ncbi:Cdc14 phosphatase binding protein N-terminus [Nakaseomyces glabratus]|nr:Cdc14 phosphatase binding protein N-terminus [Nakaseomyces glabratus]KAH7605721.1 Cdc14 phosphatase binding protein N-terminus [Nakaseomyces glabratus]
MYKLQVLLVPPSIQNNNFSLNYNYGQANNSIADQSQQLPNKVNGTFNNTFNGQSQPDSSIFPVLTRSNSSLLTPNYYAQRSMKKFLHFTKANNTLLDLSDEINDKCKAMYPSLEADLDILSLQDSNGCDLDPDFVVKDVFNVDNIVRVILNDELDISEITPVSSYRSIKRRRLNPESLADSKDQSDFGVESQSIKVVKKRGSTSNVIKGQSNINGRISTPLARQLYPPSAIFEPQNSDDEEVADRSFLPPPIQPGSPPIRISSGIDTNVRKITSRIGEQDTVSRSATVDPDKSRQQRLLSGTPVMSTMTPNRVTLTGQRVISEQRPNDSVLTFTNRHINEPSHSRRITSGMLQIPEPKIAEMEKELLEGPSSPSTILPPIPDKIPMKKPFIETERYYSEDSSETESNSGEINAKSSLHRQTSIADNNGSPLRTNFLNEAVHLADLPELQKSEKASKPRKQVYGSITVNSSNLQPIPNNINNYVETNATKVRSTVNDFGISSSSDDETTSETHSKMSDEDYESSDSNKTIFEDDDDDDDDDDEANSTVVHIPTKPVLTRKSNKKIFQRDELLRLMEGDRDGLPVSIKRELLKMYPDFPPQKHDKKLGPESKLHPSHNAIPKSPGSDGDKQKNSAQIPHIEYSSEESSDSLSEIYVEEVDETTKGQKKKPNRRNKNSEEPLSELHPLKETVIDIKQNGNRSVKENITESLDSNKEHGESVGKNDFDVNNTEEMSRHQVNSNLHELPIKVHSTDSLSETNARNESGDNAYNYKTSKSADQNDDLASTANNDIFKSLVDFRSLVAKIKKDKSENNPNGSAMRDNSQGSSNSPVLNSTSFPNVVNNAAFGSTYTRKDTDKNVSLKDNSKLVSSAVNASASQNEQGPPIYPPETERSGKELIESKIKGLPPSKLIQEKSSTFRTPHSKSAQTTSPIAEVVSGHEVAVKQIEDMQQFKPLDVRKSTSTSLLKKIPAKDVPVTQVKNTPSTKAVQDKETVGPATQHKSTQLEANSVPKKVPAKDVPVTQVKNTPSTKAVQDKETVGPATQHKSTQLEANSVPKKVPAKDVPVTQVKNTPSTKAVQDKETVSPATQHKSTQLEANSVPKKVPAKDVPVTQVKNTPSTKAVQDKETASPATEHKPSKRVDRKVLDSTQKEISITQNNSVQSKKVVQDNTVDVASHKQQDPYVSARDTLYTKLTGGEQGDNHLSTSKATAKVDLPTKKLPNASNGNVVISQSPSDINASQTSTKNKVTPSSVENQSGSSKNPNIASKNKQDITTSEKDNSISSQFTSEVDKHVEGNDSKSGIHVRSFDNVKSAPSEKDLNSNTAPPVNNSQKTNGRNGLDEQLEQRVETVTRLPSPVKNKIREQQNRVNGKSQQLEAVTSPETTAVIGRLDGNNSNVIGNQSKKQTGTKEETDKKIRVTHNNTKRDSATTADLGSMGLGSRSKNEGLIDVSSNMDPISTSDNMNLNTKVAVGSSSPALVDTQMNRMNRNPDTDSVNSVSSQLVNKAGIVRGISGHNHDTATEESSTDDSSTDESSDESSSSEDESKDYRKTRRLIVDVPKGPVIDKKITSSSIDQEHQNNSVQQNDNKIEGKKIEATTSGSNSTKKEPFVGVLQALPEKIRPSLSSLSDLVSRGIPDVRESTIKGRSTAHQIVGGKGNSSNVSFSLGVSSSQQKSLGYKPTVDKQASGVTKQIPVKPLSNSESSSESSTSESSSGSESDSDSDSDSNTSSDSDSDSSSDSDSNDGKSKKKSKAVDSFISAKSASSALKKKKKSTGFASLIRDSKKR